MRTIEVLISEDGDASIDLSGFNGQGCSKVMTDFVGEDTVRKETLKREYHAAVEKVREVQR